MSAKFVMGYPVCDIKPVLFRLIAIKGLIRWGCQRINFTGLNTVYVKQNFVDFWPHRKQIAAKTPQHCNLVQRAKCFWGS